HPGGVVRRDHRTAFDHDSTVRGRMGERQQDGPDVSPLTCAFAGYARISTQLVSHPGCSRPPGATLQPPPQAWSGAYACAPTPIEITAPGFIRRSSQTTLDDGSETHPAVAPPGPTWTKNADPAPTTVCGGG